MQVYTMEGMVWISQDKVYRIWVLIPQTSTALSTGSIEGLLLLAVAVRSRERLTMNEIDIHHCCVVIVFV